MSARLKLKHMKNQLAMVEADNRHLRYELSRLSRKWELIGASEKLEPMPLLMIPKDYLKLVVSHIVRALTAKMCDNLEDCITKRLPDCIDPLGNNLDIRLLVPRFDETSVEVTLR